MKVFRWAVLFAVLLLGCSQPSPQVDARSIHGAVFVPPASGVWAPVKIGNGGVLVRFSIAADGTMVTATDSYGCYVWATPIANQWNQQLTDTSLGSAGRIDTTQPTGSGCDDIAVDPANSSNIWTTFAGNIYKSTTKGQAYSTTGFVTQPVILTTVTNPMKNFGPRTAVDPVNSTIAYFGTSAQGVFRTTDGGTTFGAPITTFAGGIACNNTNGVPITSGTDTTTNAVTTVAGTQVNFTHNSRSFGFNSTGITYVKVWSAANPLNQMVGSVTGSSGATFQITLLYGFGSGSFADWVVGEESSDGHPAGCGSYIAFDPHSTPITNPFGSGTCTPIIYVHTYGINTWKTTDCGQNWSLVNQTNFRNAIRQMAVDKQGVLWVIDDIYQGATTNINKLDGTTWTAGIVTGSPGILYYTTVATDPLNCASKSTCHVMFVAGGNNNVVSLTTDGAVGPTFINAAGAGNQTYPTSGIDVDWFSNYLTAIAISSPFANTTAFDTVSSGKVWLGGEGIFNFPAPTINNQSIAFTQQTRGIEEFVVIRSVTTPSTPGGVFLTTWDFPCFYTENWSTYPTTTTCLPATQTFLERGYSLDWVFNAPTTMVSVVQDGGGFNPSPALDFSGITTTGGKTAAAWTKFASPAPYNARATGSTIAPATFSVTGAISAGVLNVTAVSSGSVRVGATISGAGITAGTIITSRGTGTGNTGTYNVSGTTSAGSTTVSGTYGLFTVGTVTTLVANPLFAVGRILSPTGNVPGSGCCGPNITELISGTGGSGSTFAIDNNTAVSSQTINQFNGESGGCIAIKDATHMVWVPTHSQNYVQVTSDGGGSWGDTTISGSPSTFWGSNGTNATSAIPCASDKFNGDIYLSNIANNNFYKSTNGGASFSIGASQTIVGQTNFNAFMKSTGVAGHLLFSPGVQGGSLPTSSLFYLTTDGFVTTGNFVTINGFNTVLAADYGATWPTKLYPGIYAQGWYTGTCLLNGVSQSCTSEYGLWMCKELNTTTGNCNVTWARLGTRWPMGVLAFTTDVWADKTTAGLVGVWTNGGAYWIQGQ